MLIYWSKISIAWDKLTAFFIFTAFNVGIGLISLLFAVETEIMHEITKQSVLQAFQEEKRISWDDFPEKEIFFDICPESERSKNL